VHSACVEPRRKPADSLGRVYDGPIVDCDIHHDWPSQDALLPYLSAGWREYATRSGGRQPMPVIPSEIHPNPGGVFRDDAWPEAAHPAPATR
jgi:hypothetical protein